MRKTLLKNGAALMALFFMSMGTSLNLSAQTDICFEPDDFISYPFSTTGIAATVALDDQFIDSGSPTAPIPVLFDIFGPTKLLNPATKWHNGKKFKPERPNIHYGSFIATLPGTTPPGVLPTITGTFRVNNQFHSFNLNVPTDIIVAQGGTYTLLVPSLKNSCEEEPCPGGILSGDHYLCYEFSEAFQLANSVDTLGRLEDQFQKNRRFDHLTPTRFCNPVVKTLTVPPLPPPTTINPSPTNHLVCYSICEKWLNPARFVELIGIQFGNHQGLVEHDDELCVPSIKTPLFINNGL